MLMNDKEKNIEILNIITETPLGLNKGPGSLFQ